MKYIRLFGMGILCVLFTGCMTLNVTTDFDPTVDFNRYTTFAWDEAGPIESGNPYIDNDLFKGRIQRIAYKALAEQGMRYDEDNPDIKITYEASAEERVEITSVYEYGTPYEYGHRIHRRHGHGVDVATHIEEKYYDELTLILQFIDASNNHLIWQGVAYGQYNLMAPSNEQDRILTEAITALFTKFSGLKTSISASTHQTE